MPLYVNNNDDLINQDYHKVELKPYYVYELRDPKDNSVFYVGKGVRRRIDDHTKAADRIQRRELDLEQEADIDLKQGGKGSRKLQKINEIKKEYPEGPIAIVIARFDTPEEAFAVEAVLMHWVYGFSVKAGDSCLTNVQGGHGSTYIRPKGNLGRLPGIDVNRERAFDGIFTQRLIAGNETYDVEGKLNQLQTFFTALRPLWEKRMSVNGQLHSAPSLYLTVGNVAKIQLILRGTGTQKPILNLRAFDSGDETLEKFKDLVSRLHKDDVSTVLKAPNSRDPYCKITGMHDDLSIFQADELLDRVDSVLSLVSLYIANDPVPTPQIPT